MNDISLINTPIGILEIHTNNDFVCKIQFISESSQKRKNNPKNSSRISKQASKEIIEYFDGTRKSFMVPIQLDLPSFYKTVLLQVKKIGYGKTASYKEIARMSGNDKATRAVGTANSKNPIPIIIPCHRIISSNGSLGGYTGGLDKKSYLLRHEEKHITR